jgi:hypothetical protein
MATGSNYFPTAISMKGSIKWASQMVWENTPGKTKFTTKVNSFKAIGMGKENWLLTVI